MARIVLFTGLAMFYYVGASEHARRVNTFKARGDQSGYLWDAKNLYDNWQGRTPPMLIGARNRMPVYAAFLAFFYDPTISDDEFFVRAKTWNIRLSLVLLAGLAVIFAWHLPPLVSTNLTLIVAFGYFVFKAGYTQSELLFYFLFFVAFLAFCYVLILADTVRRWGAAAFAGVLAALAHLTKAAMLPLVVIFIGVFVARELAVFVRQVGAGRAEAPNRLMKSLVAPALLSAAFLTVLSPYLAHNKLVFGQYFYNVNTTFYIWYNDWPEASIGTRLHGEDVGWPVMPADQIPSARKYWQTHTVREIAARILGGFQDMVVRSYHTYWYFKYVVVYLVVAVAVVAANRAVVARFLRARAALTVFLLLYAGVYSVATAFYHPISGTGTTRFLIAHLTPLLFALSWFFAHREIAPATWTISGITITLPHAHMFIASTLAMDLAFTLWPRLMTTYGGF